VIGREAELSLLNERYNSDRYEMMPIYGRRRVGKTTLLKEFVRDKNGVYFSATRGNIHDNINRLGSRILGIDSKVEMSLDEVLVEVRKRSMNERYLLIIDEYPNLIRKSPEINDILQEFLDEMGESKLFLILCGSSVSIMHHEVLGYKSPIYGRRTGSLEIHPMNIWESMKILNGFDRDDALKIYGMVGGVPMYLLMFDPSLPLNENVERLFLKEDSFFRNEHEFVLMEEFENPFTYFSILQSIADGKNKISEIASCCGLDQATVHKHLKSLMSTDFIEKIAPVDNPEGKSVRYEITDSFLRFQFRRILPIVEYVNDLSSASDSIVNLMETDMGRIFEGICAQHLIKIHPGQIGKWWGSDPINRTQEEIDLVSTSINNGKRIGWFAECKYRNEPVGTEVLETLIHRIALVKGYDETHPVIYSKSGFTESLKERKDVELIDIDDFL